MLKKTLLSLFLVLAIALAACEMGGGGTAAPEAGATEPSEAATEPAATEAPEPGSQTGLPPEPQPVTFQASDGQALSGLYYPAAVDPAPLVVLMHWVGGDMSDWYEIAPWLQNRGLANPFENPGDESWWDPTWFPTVPADRSYGVFIFSFRGCGPFPAGCANWTPDVWLLDARAAMLTAATLPGVDPAKIVAIGSSIGADGAADGCAWLNEQTPGACQGALSLSPGDFLNASYTQAVQSLGAAQPPVAAWCLADENEIIFCNQAGSAGNPEFQTLEIRSGQHGNMLLRPGLNPLPLQLILDFLTETVGP
jgi:hypothetical protein